jgi:hypothetical protein
MNAAKPEKEKAMRAVWVKQGEKESAAEIAFLEKHGVQVYDGLFDMTDEELLEMLAA